MALASPRKKSANRPPRRTSEPGLTHQALKSAQTRARLIEATITCLVKHGYAGTTAPQVAAEAGLSRGAMLHHFENGGTLIKATIVELHDKRLRAFRRAAELSKQDTNQMVGTYWRQLQKPAFVAFHELALAARTNSDLAGILHPLQVEFRERFYAEGMRLYPEWQADPAKFALAMTLSQTMMEGMAINLLTGAMDPAMVDPMLQLVEAQVAAMRPKEYAPEPVPA